MKKIIAWSEPTIFNQDITELIEDYYKCLPVKLSQNNQDDLATILDLVKESAGGVILAGGNDVWPGSIGAQCERGDGLSKFDILRDKREIFTINYCFENDIPVMAICRGFQILLSSYYGLYLMPDISGHPIVHSPGNEDIKLNVEKGEYAHWVSCLQQHHEEFFRREWCVSAHHQAISFSLKHYKESYYENMGVDVIGVADLNLETKEKHRAIIELARGLQNRWIACQYHPEACGDYLRNPAAKKVVDYFGNLIG